MIYGLCNQIKVQFDLQSLISYNDLGKINISAMKTQQLH